MGIALNPDLDAAALAPIYAEKSRMQIKNLFPEETAERIHGWLEQTPWGLTFNDGETVNQLTLEECNALTPQDQQAIQQRVFQNAAKQYQFLYNYWPLLGNYFKPDRPASPLYAVFEFVNSPAFLDFTRMLTGRQDIKWADGHATLFRGGHFLKYHTDTQEEEQRIAAYVMNFTKGWGRDWGGYLQFWDEHYDGEQSLRPVFNALNIFTIPADHSVNYVVPYAPGLRFSITGWLRGDEPPGPIAGH